MYSDNKDEADTILENNKKYIDKSFSIYHLINISIDFDMFKKHINYNFHNNLLSLNHE